MDKDENLKIVIVGDGAIGKTCLLSRLVAEAEGKGNLWNLEEQQYVATTFDQQSIPGQLYNERDWTIEFWDTAGQEGMESLRTLSYPDTDVFLLGFSVISCNSHENIDKKWYQEITGRNVDGDDGYDANPKVVLACFKADMRDEPDVNVVSREDGELMAEKIDAKAYIETSAANGYNCKELLQLLVAIAAENRTDTADEMFPPYTVGTPLEDILAIANKGNPAAPTSTETINNESSSQNQSTTEAPNSKQNKGQAATVPLPNPPKEEKQTGCECVMC